MHHGGVTGGRLWSSAGSRSHIATARGWRLSFGWSVFTCPEAHLQTPGAGSTPIALLLGVPAIDTLQEHPSVAGIVSSKMIR